MFLYIIKYHIVTLSSIYLQNINYFCKIYNLRKKVIHIGSPIAENCILRQVMQ